MSKIIKLIRNLMFSILFIYGYNLLAQSLNLTIPFNIFTIGFVFIFGIPGFISLLLILLFGFK